MSDVIRLLPDNVANQIAAGEVIQRPASAVKELMENAIDAKAKNVTVQLKDAGRTYIRVIDDGKGMSMADARMCFERHATSKLVHPDDLFNIQTMGFRGEALASIAAVAQVELVSRQAASDLALQVSVHAGDFKGAEEIQSPEGTKITVSNLFYNVPARRNFLKSDKIEMRHIIDEFERVSLIHPEIGFRLIHNDQELFRLKKSNPRQRIVDVFGRNYNERLVPVSEDANFVRLEGFIGKPQFARKSRGEQFFFVNDRFIRSPYMHRAVLDAYEGLLQHGQHPSYFISLYVDPSFVDVNIHPTKTEIKFEDERSVYAVLKASIKRSLGQFNIVPSLDFDVDPDMVPDIPTSAPVRVPTIEVDPSYNPFSTGNSSPGNKGNGPISKGGDHQWESLMKGIKEEKIPTGNIDMNWTGSRTEQFVQLHGKYILCELNSETYLIHQERAHERILFEHFLESDSNSSSQQLLFHQTLHFKGGEEDLLLEYKEAIESMGYEIEGFGPGTLLVKAVPAGTSDSGLQELFEGLLEQVKAHASELSNKASNKLVLYLAKRLSIKAGQKLDVEEMKELIDRLFSCDQPNFTSEGHKILISLDLEELDKKFAK